MADVDPRPLVFVTVGTDHHRFDRLMDWVEGWVAREPAARVLVQHGTAHAVTGADNVEFLPAGRFRELLDEADAVVCSAGPGAIMETRDAGLRPIVVPRLGALDEVVDDHQVTFAHFLAARELVTIAQDPEALGAALDHVVEAPDDYRIDTDESTAPGITGVATLVDGLVWGTR